MSRELELQLKEADQMELLSSINHVIRSAHFSYVRQPEPLGLGHAIWTARHMIGKEYFSVFLPDDIVVSKSPALDQLIRVARQEKGSVIAIQEVPMECVSSYGIIEVKKQITPNLFQVGNLVEKPDRKDAPSNLAIIGRYVLSHKIFPSLEEVSDYTINGEIQLTDAIAHMLRHNEKVFAYKIRGTRYDIGTPIGWIKAVIGYSLQDPRYASHVKKFLAELETTESFLFNASKTIEHTI
jgi:UTP--glucose-1-phosphate uridylyltransferase